MPPRPQNSKIIFFIVMSLILLSPPQAVSSQKPQILKKSNDYQSIPVKVVKTIPLPKSWHEGLFLDGGNIWVTNGNKGKVWVVDTLTGKIASEIEPVAGFTEAVIRKTGNLFFTTEWDEKKLYVARLDNGKLKPELWVSFPRAHPAGVIWDGKQLLVITWTRGLGTKFDIVELDGSMNYTGQISVKEIQEPAHLAWDGKNLWITSWYDPLVYKVDVDKWEILGAFPSPVTMTTGIVCDGEYIWLTGTHSDLYKVEITLQNNAAVLGEESSAMKIVVTSSAFKDGEMIPGKYTCDGRDISPPLAWTGVPPGTKSIALISDDPDAPMGTWIHWVAFNIPPEAKGLPEGVPAEKTLPDGTIQGTNGSRRIGYDGPCPPSGVHRYFFKVYALDTKLSLDPGVAKKDLEKAMAGHILAEGQLMGRYKR